MESKSTQNAHHLRTPFAQPAACPQTRLRRMRSHLASVPAARLLQQAPRRRCRSPVTAAFSTRLSRRCAIAFDAASPTRLTSCCAGGTTAAPTAGQRQSTTGASERGGASSWRQAGRPGPQTQRVINRPATIAAAWAAVLSKAASAALSSVHCVRSPRLGPPRCARCTHTPDLRRRWW